MTISGSNLGFTIMKIAAENSVESSKSQRAAARAVRKAAEESVNIRRAADEQKHQNADVKAISGIVQSGVKAGMAVKGVGDAAQTAGQKTELRSDLAEARATGDQDAMRAVELPGGEPGQRQTIEDRFGRDGADALLSGDTRRETLEAAGFHEEEIQSLQNLSFGDQITPEQASDWMVEHQAPPQSFGQRLKGKIPELLAKGFDQAVEETGKDRGETAKALEMKDKFRGLSDEIADADLEQQRELGEAMLGFLRGESQPGQRS